MTGDIDLIGAIYDTIIDPSGWDGVVRGIVQATNSGGAATRQLAGTAHVAAVCNIDPFYVDAYVQTYSKISPFLLPGTRARLVPGTVWADSHITRTDSYRASAFYNEWARPQGWDDFVEIGLLRAPDAFSCLVLMRSADAAWVEPAEWHLLQTLAPHLKRAAEVHQLLARERVAKESLGAGIAAAGFAAFLLSKDYRVIFANAKAEELLRRGEGLRCVHGRLLAATIALTERIAALTRGAAGIKANEKANEDEIGGTIELPCGAGRPALIAHLFPVASIRTASIFDIERPATALFVIDPAANFGAKIERFAKLHGLTAAETKCVEELVRGKGLPNAAARLKISESTARSHCDSIFFKTATNRQGELIRRFFETAI